jgi:hypothetical protein
VFLIACFPAGLLGIALNLLRGSAGLQAVGTDSRPDPCLALPITSLATPADLSALPPHHMTPKVPKECTPDYLERVLLSF